MWEKIEQINDILRQQGKTVIQEKKMKKDGRVIGKVQYGYIPQAVFDAVNQVIGPENWKYGVLDVAVHESQVIASVEVFIRVGDEWLSKGQQFGQSNIVKGNLGDAKKGAITDAIQKCFSLWSIGSDAYAGKLEKIWKGQNNQKPAQPQTEGQSSETTDNPLPQLDGVKYEKKEGKIIAIGNTIKKRQALKFAGFKWDSKEQFWYKKAA